MALSIEDMAVFCKKKGFVYPSAEIYGGIAGFFDYGPLGVELKKNLEDQLWKRFVRSRCDVVGIDGSIITNPKVWQASGHVDCFEDIMLECTKCHHRFRGDHMIEDKLNINAEGISKEDVDKLIKENSIKCPDCKSELGKANQFNLMFDTNVGPVGENTAYLRPETAQLIFTNFRLVQENARMKLPFGIAQTGKAFRNEISPRDFLFRVREFEQFEIEFFIHPKKTDDCPMINDVEAMEINILLENDKDHKKAKIKDLLSKKILSQWHAYWLGQFYKFFLDMGINPANLRIRQHVKDELAHYARACFDIEYNFPFGWKEIHGNADRQSFDLEQHAKHSKKDLSFFDEESKEKVTPSVIEPSQGIGRAMLAFMFDAYEDDKKRGNIVLKLSPKLAPVKLGIFPLVGNKEEVTKLAMKIYNGLKDDFACQYDKSGSVGRRYARADEAGIPYCITIDFDTLEDDSVTIRDRDTTKQERIKIAELREKIINLL
ncbi:glycine--tRNA ligase [Candidatus Woesearchaeota archaeon]|nr:glycine--tRNA ligase [Candidatus Woesearchaeota archaeon]